ncbi:uncharacterized protein LOC113556067 [Rhopalosiphum maidis]|uniref:Predicted protein n=1 Tax=Hordeum vulgare subsp. vulgare TaxID=112509 RepID=F2D3E9_HORVV|nr:uncharacterized protein LOC113556067 [Rhopalosiphum maidis]BAJ89620.1 predicted protein [Hordeum vulgare subsp. vulgare]
MRWTGFWIVPLVLGCCDAADVRPAANRNDGGPPRPLGLHSVISRALSRVRESTRDHRLAGDLWLETVDSDGRAEDGGSTATSGPLPDDLAAQADAVFDNHRLSWRDAVVRGLDLSVYKDREKQRYVLGITRRTGNSQATRTFGVVGRRRMQMFFMLPVMYKLGVITTLLTGLVVLTLKGVTIGVILLIIALSSIVAKLSKFHNPYASAPMPAISGWSGYHHDPYDRSSPQQPLSPLQDKNIHVHVHTGPGPVPPAVSYAKSPPPPMPQLADDDEVNNYNSNNYYYNGGGGAYWNRAGEEYYNAPAMNHYHRGDNHQLGAESTTASNSVYQQWLG